MQGPLILSPVFLHSFCCCWFFALFPSLSIHTQHAFRLPLPFLPQLLKSCIEKQRVLTGKPLWWALGSYVVRGTILGLVRVADAVIVVPL